MADETETDDECEFILERFNPVRSSRGAPAAELTVRSGDLQRTLWMSNRDIDKNIIEFGPHPGLIEAKEAYRKNVRFDRMA